jgi:hypothetical protein
LGAKTVNCIINATAHLWKKSSSNKINSLIIKDMDSLNHKRHYKQIPLGINYDWQMEK